MSTVRSKEELREQLKETSFSKMDRSEQEELCLQVFGYRDLDLVKQLSKKAGKLNLHFLEETVDYKDLLFLQEFFENMGRKCQLDAADEVRIFALAADSNAKGYVSYLFQKRRREEFYPLLAAASEDCFDLLRQVKSQGLSGDLLQQVGMSAILADNGSDRIEVLENHGWAFQRKRMVEEFETYFENRSYSKDKAGNLERTKDEGRLRFLRRRVNLSEDELRKEDRNNRKERRMSLQELLTGKKPEKTYTQRQQEKKERLMVARDKKRRKVFRSR